MVKLQMLVLIPFFLFALLQVCNAADQNEHIDKVDTFVGRSLADTIPYSSNYEVAQYDTGGKHGGGHHGGGKKKGRRAAAQLQLSNLLRTTASVQNELQRQGALQMKLAQQIQQQRLFRPPQKTSHTHYHYNSEESSTSDEEDYHYPYPPQSKVPYHPPQSKVEYQLLETMPVIDLTHMDFSGRPAEVSHSMLNKKKKKKGLFSGGHKQEMSSPLLPIMPLEPLPVPQPLVAQPPQPQKHYHQHHHHPPPPPPPTKLPHTHPAKNPYPAPPHGHNHKAGYGVPELYDASSSLSAAYSPVKNTDAYYSNLGNPYGI